MAQSNFGTGFKSRIQEKYIELGYTLGWRLLYSPEAVLERARVAFVGLTLAAIMYRRITQNLLWKVEVRTRKSAGVSLLGRARYNARCCDCLRSLENLLLMSWPGQTLCLSCLPSWEMLGSKDQALRLGRNIWEEILAHTRPQLVIGMGGNTWPVLKQTSPR